jgi:hypothetical protein
MDNNTKNNLTNIKNKLDKIGPGFCLAKWTQTTIHLGLGHTHSCHHPGTHVIPIEEVNKDPSVLHNTPYKKEIRKEMLLGKRPAECQYCWKVEDLKDPDLFSDRVLKSNESWSEPYFDEVLIAGAEQNFNPKYLEISFSNVCNFKCSYCMPSVSSQWAEEIERYGPYPTSTQFNTLAIDHRAKKIPIPVREHNPYIEAFWKWFPIAYKDLHTFRITGGEPLLDKNTIKVLDFIIENPNSNLVLSINTNLCVPDSLYDTFIEKIRFIKLNNKVKDIILYTSCEAHGSCAEYIRFGMNYKKWISNFQKYLTSVPGGKVTIMATYNALSITTFNDFLNDMLKIKKVSGLLGRSKEPRVHIDIPHLTTPTHQSVKILTKEFLPFIDLQIQFMEKNVSIVGFNNHEIHKLKRVKSIIEKSILRPDRDVIVNRRDFVIFVDEHDRRRGTNFLETFPEMADFYHANKVHK